jgi:hypothetical protein
VAVGPDRPHHLCDLAEQLVGQLLLTAVPIEPGRLRSSDIASNRLSVHVGHPADPVQTLAGQKEPEHLFHLVHAHLPVAHLLLLSAGRLGASAPAGGPAMVDPREVVPSVADEWSHARGGN